MTTTSPGSKIVIDGEMVAKFWEKRAEDLLREMKAEVRPGTVPHEKGSTSTDIS